MHDTFARMKITLNNEPMTIDGDTVTVERLLELRKYTFRLRIVKINGRIIDRDSYAPPLLSECCWTIITDSWTMMRFP